MCFFIPIPQKCTIFIIPKYRLQTAECCFCHFSLENKLNKFKQDWTINLPRKPLMLTGQCCGV